MDVFETEIFQTAVSAGIPSGAAAWLVLRAFARETLSRLSKIEATLETARTDMSHLQTRVAVLQDRIERS